MKLCCELLVYLDKSKILDKAKEECEKYLQELTNSMIAKFPPFRFLIEIDVIDLSNYSAELANWLMEEPQKFQKNSSEILYACLQSVNDDNKAIMPAQVAVNLRLKCIPRLIRPNLRIYNGLVSFQGLLLSVSKPESYVNHAVWSCPEECEGNEVIVQSILKITPKCYVCRSILFENSGCRRCGERVTAAFIFKGSLLPKHFTVVDDMITILKPGSIYNIFAMANKTTMHVLGLEEVVPLKAPLTSPVPAEIKDLLKACKGIPWQFIYCLSSSIGVSVCPLHHFMHLKICLLLSLASVKANARVGSAIVHVLVAGYDTGYVGRLMEKGAELADRAVYLGTTNTAVSTALVASSGGVCVMPLPLHTYNQKETSAILSSIETCEVTTETSKVNLRSAVWAQGMDFKKTVIMNVASVFGTVCRGDNGEYTDEIVDFLLLNAIENPDTPESSKKEAQALKDVKDYIDLVAGIEVALDAKTEDLLRNYFLAARRERPRGVTVGSMGALVALCMTSARLCGRAVAAVDDAVLAVWLHASGGPEPRFAPEEYLQTPADVKRLHKMMEQFKDWLDSLLEATLHSYYTCVLTRYLCMYLHSVKFSTCMSVIVDSDLYD